MRVEVAALPAARPLSRIGSWISARMPFVWRTRMFLWIALALGATAVAAGYGIVFDQLLFDELQVDNFIRSNLLVWLTGARWLLYGVIFLVVVDTVRRTRPVVRFDHHLRVAGCVAVAVFFASLPPLVFVATLVSQLTDVPVFEAVARPQFPEYLRGVAPDSYDQNVTVTAALVMSLLAGILAATFSSSFAPDVLGLMRGGWSFHVRSWRRRGAPLDRALAVRSPILWSARAHRALVPIAVPPATLALVSILPITTEAFGYGSAALFIVFLFLSFRSQEAMRFVPLPWRAELTVFLIHAAIIGGAAVVCFEAAPSLGLTAHTLGDDYPGYFTATVLGTLFMASAMQAARNVSSIGVFGIIVAVASAYAGLALTFIGFGGGDDASFTIAVFGAAFLVVLAATVSVRREMRPSFRRHALSATLAVGPMPALGYLILAGTPGDITPSVEFVSVVLGVTGVALALYATRNPRRALAYTAR